MSDLYRKALITHHLDNHNPVGLLMTSNEQTCEEIKVLSTQYNYEFIVYFFDGVYFIFLFQELRFLHNGNSNAFCGHKGGVGILHSTLSSVIARKEDVSIKFKCLKVGDPMCKSLQIFTKVLVEMYLRYSFVFLYSEFNV